MVAANYSIFY